MRTTLNLDDEALATALKAAPGKTKTDVINEALREFARRRRVQELLEFEGKMHWEGDLSAGVGGFSEWLPLALPV